MTAEANKKMKNAVAWVEIPASEMDRAKSFYESILDVEMVDLELPDLEMSMFPVEETGVGAALCKHDNFYYPSHEGPLVYFSANPDLQQVLDRIEGAGGKIIQNKTQISDEYGFMAIFEDSEGNRVALHSEQ